MRPSGGGSISYCRFYRGRVYRKFFILVLDSITWGNAWKSVSNSSGATVLPMGGGGARANQGSSCNIYECLTHYSPKSWGPHFKLGRYVRGTGPQQRSLCPRSYILLLAIYEHKSEHSSHFRCYLTRQFSGHQTTELFKLRVMNIVVGY